MGQKNTMLGKSVGVSDEEKLFADNTVPYNILNTPEIQKVKTTFFTLYLWSVFQSWNK